MTAGPFLASFLSVFSSHQKLSSCLSSLCCNGGSMFCLVCPDFCPVPSVFLSLRKNAERISMKLFAGGNHYHQQIKWLHFGWNWNMGKGAGCNRIFESKSIGFAAMSNRCWRLSNEFTNLLAMGINAGTESI